MPPNFLAYARPRLKKISARGLSESRQSRWFTITAQVIVLLLIGAPIGALTVPLFNHSYGLIGAVVFVVISICLLRLLPPRTAKWHFLLGAAIVAIAITVVLHIVSKHTFDVENVSGQMITKMSWDPAGGNRSFYFQKIPPGIWFRFSFHDLLYDGKGSVGIGELADGAQLHSSTQNSGTNYHRRTKIRVEPGGEVKVSWP